MSNAIYTAKTSYEDKDAAQAAAVQHINEAYSELGYTDVQPLNERTFRIYHDRQGYHFRIYWKNR